MSYRFAINGLGRIGRAVLRSLFEHSHQATCVAINTLYDDAQALAYLLNHDSVHGRFPWPVQAEGDCLLIKNQRIPLSRHRDPSTCPWQHVDVVFECTGLFTQASQAQGHLEAGAKKVLISAPGKEVDATIVYGVNHHSLQGNERIVSNASCTTNCLAPLVKPLEQHIASGIMTTVHAITGDQSIIDMPHSDWRRGRLAYRSIIPTATGAARAIGAVIPSLAGRLDGFALRVPTDNVSLVDLTLQLREPLTVEQAHSLFKTQAEGPMQGVLVLNDQPRVSIDFNHTTASSILDLSQTRSQGNTLKLLAWYDNEWGFANRMLDTASVMMGTS